MKFRFPIAILHYWKEAGDNKFTQANIIELAREWAVTLDGKRPTITQAEKWIAQLVEDDRRQKTEEAT